MPPGTDAVAVNTGPLIALAPCGELGLLRHLHSRVLVPREVEQEFRQCASGDAATLPDWIELGQLTSLLDPLLVQHLDVGEASAIALALQEGLHTVVIDERRGRLLAPDSRPLGHRKRRHSASSQAARSDRCAATTARCNAR